MATNPNRHNPDVEQYPKHDRFDDLPVIPKGERQDWRPFRSICKQAGYSLPRSFGEGWVARVSNWRFQELLRQNGQASPGLLVIHKSWLPDFYRAAGVEQPDETPDALTALDAVHRFLGALDDANDDFQRAVDAAQKELDEARSEAETNLLDELGSPDPDDDGD